ncbi:hypothetical protein HDU99_009856, partial [Rhizoclosmatium hyalinum]
RKDNVLLEIKQGLALEKTGLVQLVPILVGEQNGGTSKEFDFGCIDELPDDAKKTLKTLLKIQGEKMLPQLRDQFVSKFSQTVKQIIRHI